MQGVDYTLLFWCSAHAETCTNTQNKKRTILLYFLSQTFFMSTIESHPAFFSLFPSHLVFSFWSGYLNQPTLLTPPPQPQDIWLFMSEGEKQQVWGSAPNTGEVIQFRVGSKSCGRLCTARSGVQRGAGGMHIKCWWWRLADACPWFWVFWGFFCPEKIWWFVFIVQIWMFSLPRLPVHANNFGAMLLS